MKVAPTIYSRVIINLRVRALFLVACKRTRWSSTTGVVPRTAYMPSRGDSLHLAATRGKVYRVAACLAKGHDPDGLDRHGRTALFIACMRGHLDVAQALLRAGADVNCRTPEGASPLEAALEGGYSGLLRELVWAGADLKAAGPR